MKTSCKRLLSIAMCLLLAVGQMLPLIACNKPNPPAQANYVVERYFEDLNGNFVKDDEACETLTATVGEVVQAETKSYEHFTLATHADEIRSGEITADGMLVLKLYYEREMLAVSYVVEGEEFDRADVKYGAKVSATTKNVQDISVDAGLTKVFSHWSTTQNGEAYDFSTDIVAPVTLYAVFRQVVKTYGLNVVLDDAKYFLVKAEDNTPWAEDFAYDFTAVEYGTEFQFKVVAKEGVTGVPVVTMTTFDTTNNVVDATTLSPDGNGIFTATVQANTKLEITGFTKTKTVDMDDTSFGYFGAWGVYEDLAYYGGRAHGSYTKGDYALFTVNDASAIRIIGDKAPDRAKINVYLDGELIQTIDLYADTRAASQILFEATELSADAHTVRIENTGETSGSGTWVVIDRISVLYNNKDNIQGLGENFDPPAPPEEVFVTYGDQAYGYFGKWTMYTGGFVGGFANASSSAGDYVLLQVKDVTALTVYCEKNVDRGEVDVYVDGALVDTVSGYSATKAANQVLWQKTDFTAGYHTVKLVNKAAPQPWLVLERFEVKYIGASDYVSYDDTSFGYEGAWGPYRDAAYMGGYAHGSNVQGASYTFHVADAKTIKLYGNKAPDRAKANIYVDGVLHATVDTYSAAKTAVEVICQIENLAEGDHTIKIENTGETSGTGTWLVIDDISISYYDGEAIRGVGEQAATENKFTEYDDVAFHYVGTWQTHKGDHYAGGYVNASVTAGDYFIWSFTDVKKIVLWGAKGPDRVKADIYLDGIKVATIDTYDANYTAVLELWSMDHIEKGTHTLRIVNTGEMSGTGTWLLIDTVTVTYYDEENMIGPNETKMEESKKKITLE